MSTIIRNFRIENTTTGTVLGVYPGEDMDEALDARDAGYADFDALDEMLSDADENYDSSDLLVEEVTSDAASQSSAPVGT